MSLQTYVNKETSEEVQLFDDEIECIDDKIIWKNHNIELIKLEPDSANVAGYTKHYSSHHPQWDKRAQRAEWVKKDNLRAEKEYKDKAFHNSMKKR